MKRLCIYILLLTGIACAYAMPVYEQEWQASPAIQNQHLMHTGVTYNGTIYTPFDNTVPSDYSAVGASYGQRGPFKSPIDGGGDWEELPDHDHTDLSPVGEPWIMILFALLFAGIIARRKYTTQISNRE